MEMVDSRGNVFEFPEPQREFKSWRSMTADDCAEFEDWTEGALTARWLKGAETYHSDVNGFQGDPLDHAIEEALDLLLYLWMAKRQREAEEDGLS